MALGKALMPGCLLIQSTLVAPRESSASCTHENHKSKHLHLDPHLAVYAAMAAPQLNSIYLSRQGA